jgi:hypothetical protein
LRGHSWTCMIRRIIEYLAIAFVVCVGAAMFLYPGGTWWNHSENGHSFWQNFLCDLLRNPALNNQDNTLGAALTKAGMLCIVAALSLNWWTVSKELCCQHRLRRIVRVLGTFGTPLVATVPLFPSDDFPRLHTAAVTLGGLPAMFALVLFNISVFREVHCPKWVRTLTTLLAVLSIVCMGLYVRESVFGAPSLRILPVLERLATFVVICWIGALLRRAPAPRSA